jgi:superoxide dismutase, Fe-Mn family
MAELRFHSKGKLMEGHINLTLFFFNLASKAAGGGNPARAPKLSEVISAKWGSVASFISAFNAEATALQGSGWVWLVKNKKDGSLTIVVTHVAVIVRFANFRAKTRL